MKLFGLIGLLILWNCSCVDRHRSHALCEQSLIDSLEVRAQDSLFSNLPYSRSLLRNAMSGTGLDELLPLDGIVWKDFLHLVRFRLYPLL